MTDFNPTNFFIETDAAFSQFMEKLNLKGLDLKDSISNTIEMHEKKLAFIKEELATNRYQINNHLIAERLLEHAIEEEPEIA